MTTTTKFNIGAHQVVNTLDFRDGGVPLRFDDEYLFHSKKELLESL